jgi:replicative DNA helicase
MQNTTRNFVKNKPTESFLGKKLPANIEAEKSVLAAILLNDKSVAQAAEFITAKDFYVPAHRSIFQIAIDLINSNKRVDIVTLQDELEKKKLLDEVGGIGYLLSIQEDIPVLGLVEQHAKIVREKSILRDLISSATDIITSCFNQEEKEIEAILDEAEKVIFQISNKKSSENFIQLDIWLKKTFQHLSEIKSHKKGITGVSTGFSKFDEITSGLQKGDFIVVAGRPSMGKTALSLNMAINSALLGCSVGIFSLEMSAEQLTLRLLSSESGTAHHKIRNATISSDEWVSLTNVAAQLAELKLYIDDTAGLSLMELRARARKLKAEKNIDLLVIDYLQMLHSGKRHENRHQEVSEISRSLKSLAKELAIPILVGSQLSRAVDSRMDKRPMLSDLRESGAIEQDADVIMFLYRDIVYNSETENPCSAELIIGKQRNGPTGTIPLNFIRELTKFEDVDS